MELNLKNAAVAKLQAKIDDGQITSANEADEAVCELLGESGLDIESDEYSELSAELCDVAGKEFPGDWEDYPKGK